LLRKAEICDEDDDDYSNDYFGDFEWCLDVEVFNNPTCYTNECDSSCDFRF